jgi:hypothetical protein
MWGILLGAASVIGLSRLARYRAWRYGYGGCHRGFGGYGWGRGYYPRDRSDWRGDSGRSERFMLRRLFEHLDTTPGQEKVISEAFDSVASVLRESKGNVSKTRHDLADAIRQEQLDMDKVRELLSEQQGRISQVGTSISDSVAKIHAVLDVKQRERLAEMIEQGFRRSMRSPWHDV